jgi:HEXXH motif-containing protein
MTEPGLFAPSVVRARLCRAEMDRILWSSVRELLGQLVGDALPPAAMAGGNHPTDMLDYAAYFDLALAHYPTVEVTEPARARAIAHLQARLAAGPLVEATAEPPRLSHFSQQLYTPEQLDQMRRWWDIEPANRMSIGETSDEDFRRSRAAFGTALSHLRNAAPELCEETQIIVRDVVFSQPDGNQLINYSGASSFALWGALTINCETQRDWTQHYRQLVHEAGHNLLFGLARDEQFVLDDPADRHRSPIRDDPRPMDGIFHAAFVSAREALAIDALLILSEQTGCLPEDDAGILEDMLEISVPAFWEALDTLRTSATLTPLGTQLLADCEAYMSANFAFETC